MKLISYIIFILGFFAIKPIAIYGQGEYYPHHSYFNTDDGLPSNRIYDLMQDSKGYIWAATANGLVKFNGRSFKEYKTVESINPEYSYLKELKDGSIWCINFGNQVLKVSDDSLKVVDVFKPYISDKKYFILHSWQDSILYLENQDRIVSYNPFNEELNEIVHSKDSQIFNFSRHQSKLYYASKSSTHSEYKYCMYDIQSQTTTSTTLINGLTYESNGINYFAQDSLKGHYPLFIIPFDPTQQSYQKQKNAIFTIQDAIEQRIASITHFDENNIWASTKKGCVNLNLNKTFFPNHFITRVIRDSESNYWFSTYNNGILFIPNLDLNILTTFKTGINDIVNINDSEILVGGQNGYAYTYNVDINKITDSLFLSENNTKTLTLFNQNKNILIQEPFSFARVLNTKKAINKPLKRSSINLKNFDLIDDHLLIHKRNNIIQIFHHDTYLNKRGAPLIKLSDQWILTDKSNKKNPSSNYLYYEYVDKKINVENIHYEAKEKRIWIAFTTKTSTEQNQEFNDFQLENGQNLTLNCFADHMNSGIIAAKREHGLVFINENKISSETNHKIYKDYGSIRKIITTDNFIISLAIKGIIISDSKGKPVYTLDETDGLKGSIINNIHYKKETLWIGTTKGLYKLPIQSIYDNSIAPKTYINEYWVNNKKVNNLNQNNRFPNNSDIEFFFESLCYKGRNNSYFEYKLKESEEWNTISISSNSIRFPNLASGNYNFSIRVINEEGIKGEINQLSFRVMRPFWLQWWFILGSVATIISILYYYNKWNLKQIEKENQAEKKRIEKVNQLEKFRIERENQLEQEIRSNKLSALQSRMNPHFIFNSLNSIQDFIIKLDRIGANEYLGIFSDLMRVYLTHSEKDHVELNEEIEALKLYLKLEELRFGDILVNFYEDPELNDLDIFIPPLFIQPYIENAFKHGLLHKKDNKELNIEFKLFNNQLLIHIEDNGVGRKKVQEIQNRTTIEGLSYATKANLTRLELLNYNRTNKIMVNTIDLHNKDTPSGTLVEIIIPILN